MDVRRSKWRRTGQAPSLLTCTGIGTEVEAGEDDDDDVIGTPCMSLDSVQSITDDCQTSTHQPPLIANDEQPYSCFDAEITPQRTVLESIAEIPEDTKIRSEEVEAIQRKRSWDSDSDEGGKGSDSAPELGDTELEEDDKKEHDMDLDEDLYSATNALALVPDVLRVRRGPRKPGSLSSPG